MHGARWVVLLLLAPALAGCVTDPSTEDAESPGDPRLRLKEVPPGCDASRPAVAHRADAVPVADPGVPLPIPCLLRTGVRSAEPRMGVAEDGTIFFYPAEPDGGRKGAGRSRDGGASWDIVYREVAGVPSHQPPFLDPFMHLDPDTGRVFILDLSGAANCSHLSWSDDRGETWDGSVAGCALTDHQKLTTGAPRAGPTVGYANVVYYCAYSVGATGTAGFAAACQRSLDGGRTWLPPGLNAFEPAPTMGNGDGRVPGRCSGGIGDIATDGEGRLFLAKGWCGVPAVAVSEDEGLTWTRTVVADMGMARTEDSYVDNDAGVAVDAAGNVYVTWAGEDRLPYLAVSTDHGATFGPPMMIAPPGVTEATDVYAAASGPGNVVVAMMASTNAPGVAEPGVDCTRDPVGCVTGQPRGDLSNVTWHGYLTIIVDATGPSPLLLSAAVNDPDEPLVRGFCGPGRCQEVKDFIDAEVGPTGDAWGAFVDGCSSDLTMCEPGDDDRGEAVLGRLWGGPDLSHGP